MTTKSSSSTTSSSSTLNQDNRVAASEEALAVGPGATLSINNEFSDNVAGAYKELLSVLKSTVEGAGQTVNRSVDAAIRQNSGALEAVNSAYARAQQGDRSIYTDLFPIVAVVAVGVFVVVLIKKGQK